MTEKLAEKRLIAAIQKFPNNGLPLRALLNDVELRIMNSALEKADGNKSEACKLVRMSRTTYTHRLKLLKNEQD